jgi:dTDP-glucose pyrophosphorylase
LSSDNWNKCILSPKDSIRAAIDNLISSSKRIVLIVSSDGKLAGTISDGDIRRGLLKGATLETKLSEIIQKSAIVAHPEMSREAVKQLMMKHKIQQIPIVDRSNKLLGLHEWDDLESSPVRDNLFVVMAGGKGERLMPHTLNTPKPMVLIQGKPILEHILVRARLNGFRNFVLVVHHLSQLIEDYFGDGSDWDITISYVRESSPMGTAGGLAAISESVTRPVVVTNGDVLADICYSDILDFHLNSGAFATMGVRLHEIHHPFGVVKLENHRIIEIQEKPTLRNFINAGVYVIGEQAFRYLNLETRLDMPELFNIISAAEELVCAYPLHESWIDIGTPADLETLRKEIHEN